MIFILKLCGIILLIMVVLGFCDWLRVKWLCK